MNTFFEILVAVTQEVLNYKILHKYDSMIEQLMMNDKDMLKGLCHDSPVHFV